MSSHALCVKLSLSYLDTHILSVACLAEEHARSALESTAMCFPCGHSDPTWRSFPMRALRLAFPRLCSRCCRSTVKAAVLGFANRSVSGIRDRHSLIFAFTWQVQCLVSGLGSTRGGFFHPEAQSLQLSDSEELDVVSANARDTEDSPPQSRAYEELVEVVTRAVD